MNRVPFRFAEVIPLVRVASRNWQHHKAPRMGAALAYYIALALAPMVVILLAVASWVLGRPAAAIRFVPHIQSLLGYEGAQAIQTMIEGSRQPSRGMAAALLALITVFFAASAVVGELKDSMDTIWKVPADTPLSPIRHISRWAKERVTSSLLVFACGVFLVVSLLVNAEIFAVGRYLNSGVSLPSALVRTTDWVFSFIVITVLFAFIFKVLPRVRLRWSDVAFGAVGTAFLFVAGKAVLGIYIGRADFTDTYGAAGSLIVMLVWVYYSAQVLFLGAEFTRVYAHRFGSIAHGVG